MGEKRGEKNSQAKLTDKEVLKIRELAAGRYGKMRYSKIAKMFNISRSRISDIKNRRTWTHI